MNYHNGRYNSRHHAEHYAAYLRSQGEKAHVKEIVVFDVIVVRPDDGRRR